MISVVKRKIFIDSWKGIFGTIKYAEEDRRRVIDRWRRFSKSCKDSGTIGTSCKVYDHGKLIIWLKLFYYGFRICS